ncbi:MAG: fatty acid desaturase family protein [Alphaproteobacteria bacterium]
MKTESADDLRTLQRASGAYRQASTRRSIGQIVTSFGPFLAICALLYAAPDLPIWAVVPLWIVAAAFVVRIFIIQHDCGHGSFFASARANRLVGAACSLVTLTPFAAWRRQHAGHHANWNNLDRRASGADIYSDCLTVAEYRALGRLGRWKHRLIRHPVVSLLLLPPLVFLLLYRVPFDTPKTWRKERRSVYLTDLAVVVLIVGLGVFLGFGRVLAVQIPIISIAAIIGVWLFSVQHRFEHTLWARAGEWSYAEAAIAGSSHLKLPRLLQWLTGNIGLHHVHHLNPGIPNYRLQECHDDLPGLQRAPEITLWQGLASARYALWDEDLKRMVPFGAARRPPPADGGITPA